MSTRSLIGYTKTYLNGVDFLCGDGRDLDSGRILDSVDYSFLNGWLLRNHNLRSRLHLGNFHWLIYILCFTSYLYSWSRFRLSSRRRDRLFSDLLRQ